MRKQICLTSIVILFAFYSTYSQQSQSYSRSSISTIFLKHAGTNLSFFDYVNSIQVSDKFDYNYFGNNSLPVSFQMVSPSRYDLASLTVRRNQLNGIKNPDKSTINEITELNGKIREANRKLEIENTNRYNEMLMRISDNKIANKALGSILIDPKLGYMTTEIMANRGMYNASDAEYLTAMNSERKSDMIKDKGLDLLDNTYILVFDLTDHNFKPSEKNNNVGSYLLNGTAYLFKIKVDEMKANGEFDNLVFTETNLQKLNKFNAYEFPVAELLKVKFLASTSNYEIDDKGIPVLKPESKIQNELVENVFNSAEENILKEYKPFQVQSSVFIANPISVKIGSKESLSIDDLYKISENKIDKNGIVSERKIGWVRAKKVANNKSNTTGSTQTSTFYKVASKKIEKGMKIHEVAEKGFVIGVGYSYNLANISGTTKGDILSSTGVMDGPAIQIDYITHLAPGLRVGIDFGGMQKISTKDVVYETGGGSPGWTYIGTNMFADLLIQKIFQANRLEFTPYIGAYYSTITFDKYTTLTGTEYELKGSDLEGLKNNQYGVAGGVRLGFNLGRNLQINVGYKYWKSLSDKFNDNSGKNINVINVNNGNKVKFIYSELGALTAGLRLFGF